MSGAVHIVNSDILSCCKGTRVSSEEDTFLKKDQMMVLS